mmetsp:Transcript_6141/g.9069  ORF Transcript_6141/g.9069 Transcript_6141/m.9069 type:complete len:137 (-) Transcript_6141:297-707(-)|eukprot:CAMPEP_0197234844 /NCGR_PEP_ID=MMETSP1429-20130617/2475_1 /TAXON_ID=49237 /ORGANISM="Chaetoceros  sp., Strain UNC1202" /LENGTH=136 /DNA_ID=CAMNT_0042693337 /DNA_START=100 /DNA_END=510 /DNA_ORIENTATION=-
MSNPGEQMAAAVDDEVRKFRQLQEEIQNMRNDQQLLMQQQSENEMVKQELVLLDESSQVYKMVGPVLMKNETDDAKQTVDQRLELITGELKKVEKNIAEKEEKGQKIAKKIQEMQGALQAAAADAARAATQQAMQA